MTKEINLLFAITLDYLPFITVSTLSVIKNLNKDYQLNVHILYTDIFKPINDKLKQNLLEATQYTFNKYNINLKLYDIKNQIPLLYGQNIGMWGKNISYTHYMYLLAADVLKDVKKVIFLDADMIVNCDLSKVIEIDMKDCLIAMGTPRGMEDMGDDVSNSGFVVLNLAQWRKEETLKSLLDFGKKLPKSEFCDQNLLYQYFTLNNKDRLLLLEKEYNIFPQLFYNIPLKDIKIFHFTGWECIRPWIGSKMQQRADFLWWEYAKETAFYEYFITNFVEKTIEQNLSNFQYSINLKKIFFYKLKNLFLQQIFSIKYSWNKNHKIITIFGIKIKFKVKRNKNIE